MPENCPVAHVSQHVAIIRLNSNLLAEYVWLWMQSPAHGQGQMKTFYYGETKPGLNLDQIKSILVDMPSFDEQREIVRRASLLLDLADSIESRLASTSSRVEIIIRAILNKTFRGELVPTEAEIARQQVRVYESAELLLKRVHRTPMETSKKGVRLKRKKDTIAKSDKESVKAKISAMPTRTFSFEDLRKTLPGDYEGLKDAMFTLLDDSEECVEQIFETHSKSIRFNRRVP